MAFDPKSRAREEQGAEILDDTPRSIPLRFKRAETLTEQVRAIIRNEASRIADNEGYETFDEADDFDVGDDYDPVSPYEQSLDQEINGNGIGDELGFTREKVASLLSSRGKQKSVREDGEDDKGTGKGDKRDKQTVGGQLPDETD